jgi:hypothetical protein
MQLPTLDWPYLLGLLADRKDDPVVMALRQQVNDKVAENYPPRPDRHYPSAAELHYPPS